MTIAVIVFATLMAAMVGWLVKQSLNTRPWVAAGAAPEVEDQERRWRQTLRLGLVVLLAVIASLFGLFMSAYVMRMEYVDWRPLPEPGLLWANTAVLVACSVVLQWSYFLAARRRQQALKVAVLAGGMLSAVFVVGQYAVWLELNEAGYYLATNPASAFFFILTGLHALHLVGGMVALGRTGIRLWQNDEPNRVILGVELCAVYWHFLLAVWVVLFALLSTT